MLNGDVTISDFCEDADPEAVLSSLAEWVTGSRATADEYVADHHDGGGTTLVARLDESIAGLVTLRWTSNDPAFAEHDIPLIHQLFVLPDHRRMGIATALMDAAEQLAGRQGHRTVGITVGLFDLYGPAQRLYAQRGYLPDGRGVCRARMPLKEGQTVELDHSLIIWLTKDISALSKIDSSGQATSAPLIRDRQESDLDAIVDLALESLTWHAETFADIRPAPQPESLATAYRQLDDTSGSYFRVAELDGTVVGFLTAGLHPATTSGIEALDQPFIYISDIIVTAAVRRHGIGRALLTDLDNWAGEHACHTIRLNMHADNAPAEHLYEQLGYRPSWITFRKDSP